MHAQTHTTQNTDKQTDRRTDKQMNRQTFTDASCCDITDIITQIKYEFFKTVHSKNL